MSRSDIWLVVVIVALMFLFYGEPDVFDSLRGQVMGICKL